MEWRVSVGGRKAGTGLRNRRQLSVTSYLTILIVVGFVVIDAQRRRPVAGDDESKMRSRLFSRALPEPSCCHRLMMVARSAESPFHAICAPMQSRINAITRRTPWAVEGGMALVIFGA